MTKHFKTITSKVRNVSIVSVVDESSLQIDLFEIWFFSLVNFIAGNPLFVSSTSRISILSLFFFFFCLAGSVLHLVLALRGGQSIRSYT